MSGKTQENQNRLDLGTVKVGDREFSVESLFEIDQADLIMEFKDQAALYAFFVNEMSKAERDHAVVVSEKELVYADADDYWRAEFDREGLKITENAIKSAIIRDAAYGRAINREIEARYVYHSLKGLVRALEQRADMLIQLGAHVRAEFEMTGMTIRKQEYNAMIEETKTNLKKQRQNRS